jgi:hypothetical protein
MRFVFVCIDEIRNALFQIQGILTKLFQLLSSTTDIELQTELLAVLQIVSEDSRCVDEMFNEGVMPIVSLLSNTNHAIIIPTLYILHNLLHFDKLREVMATYIDISVLEELIKSNNPLISRLAFQLKTILGI